MAFKFRFVISKRLMHSEIWNFENSLRSDTQNSNDFIPALRQEINQNSLNQACFIPFGLLLGFMLHIGLIYPAVASQHYAGESSKADASQTLSVFLAFTRQVATDAYRARSTSQLIQPGFFHLDAVAFMY